MDYFRNRLNYIFDRNYKPTLSDLIQSKSGQESDNLIGSTFFNDSHSDAKDRKPDKIIYVPYGHLTCYKVIDHIISSMCFTTTLKHIYSIKLIFSLLIIFHINRC